jgi:hypothetical protein
LLAQGKITVDGASKLLSALGEGATANSSAKTAESDATPPRYMRIVVHRAAGQVGGHAAAGYAWPGVWRPEKNVNIRIPLSLVRSGMRLGAILPGGAGDVITQVLRDRGIALDFSKLDPSELAAALKNLGEVSVDVDSGRAQIRITCE